MVQKFLKIRGGGSSSKQIAAAEPIGVFRLKAKLVLGFVCFFAMIVLGVLPFQPAHASYNNYTTIDGTDYCWYRVDASGQLDATNGKYVCVEQITASAQPTVKVPSTINGLPVARFGEYSKAMTLTGVSNIDLSSCNDLEFVYISNATSQINSLNLTNCSKLKTLYCQNVGLTTLNLTGCSSLSDLYCSQNKLNTLDLQSCTSLTQFMCWENQLTALNLSKCTSLRGLGCQNNKITQLNLGACSNLTSLQCQSNELTALDLSACQKMSQFDCANNRISNEGIAALKSYALSMDMTIGGSWGPKVAIIEPQTGQQATVPDPVRTDIATCAFSAIANQTYSGSALTPKPTIKLGNKTLTEGADYTLSYHSNINAGMASLVVTGKGLYTGTKSISFRINAKNVASCAASVGNQNHTGKALTPTPTVKDGTTLLKLGTDYTVSYKNNVNVGTATIIITGNGNYTGSKAITFKINGKESWVKSGAHWMYKNADGTYVKNGSKAIAGQTYRFDVSGWMSTGWVKDGSYWYYHDGFGAMVKGWKKLSGKWYYLDPSNGAMKTGFFNVGSSRYYADGNGVMQTGWKKISNNWYYFNGSGAMSKGWTKVGSQWYYLDPSNGVMMTGWFTENGKRYYLKSSGAMATGWLKVSDTWYFFNNSGVVQKGWLKSGGKWYYLDENGEMVTEKTQIGNDTFLLRSNGVMATGWNKEGSDWFYYKPSGAMVKDAWVGNYWLDSDGMMALNAWVDNGKYYVGSTGSYVPATAAKTAVTNLSGYYTVKSSLGNRALDMSASSTALGGNAQIWDVNGSAAQTWQFTNMGNGYYRIVNAGSNLPLDVECGLKKDGTNVRQWEWNASGAQLWKVYKSNFGGYVFINKTTGKALDVSGGVNKNGTNVHIWTENNTKAQSWTLTKKPYTQPSVTNLSGLYFKFRTNVGSRYLDMSAASKANGGNAQLWEDTRSNAQVWRLEAVGRDPYYRIVNVNSGKVLDVAYGNKANGTNVQQWDWSESEAPNKCWKVQRSLYGGYIFTNMATGKVLDVSGGVNANGVNVQIWDKNDTKAQSWVLESAKPYSQSSATSTTTNRTKMNSEEYACAKQIFDAYNQYRASKGLNQVSWSDDCANMAYNSATGCSARGSLIHRLGIPSNLQNNHSDILQYATWKMSGTEAVNRWKNSDSHRKMMQCNSAKVAGVAAYKNSKGVWYYVIVYDFKGSNQSGY